MGVCPSSREPQRGGQYPVYFFATSQGQQSTRDSQDLVRPQERHCRHLPGAEPGAHRLGLLPETRPSPGGPGPSGQQRKQSLPPGELWLVGLSLSSALLAQSLFHLPRAQEALMSPSSEASARFTDTHHFLVLPGL